MQVIELVTGAHGFADALDDRFHAFGPGSPNVPVECPRGPLQHGFIRDDVERRPRVEAPDGDHGRCEGLHFSTDEPLEGVHHLDSDVDGIDTDVRHGPVASAAEYLDGEGIHGRHGGAVDDADLSFGDRRPYVGPEGVVDLRVFHDALFDHRLGSAEPFFRRLKNELDGPLQPILHRTQDRGRSQKHGHMRIVAAGVHDAVVLGSKGKPGFFSNGKGVHVRPYHDRRSGFRTFDRSDQAVFGDACLNRDSKLLQGLFDKRRSFRLGESDFRDPVKLPSCIDDELSAIGGLFFQIDHGTLLLLK